MSPPGAYTTVPDPVDKLQQPPAAWMQARLKLAAGNPLLDDSPSSALLIDRLDQAGRIDEALCLAAYALPPREAVWWACMCARHTKPAEPLAADVTAGEVAEAWVRSPGEPARARAYRAAHQARFQSPESMAAMGAFWSGQPDILRVPEDTARGQVGRSVENAVRMSAVRGPMPEQPARLRAFLQSARDIARGGAGRLDTGAYPDRLTVAGQTEI
ncbi:MAG: DUF6931 family protein [Janthinobacterium lividum]